MEKNDAINFKALERELQAALAADEKYQRENAAKLQAVEQRVPSYEEFRLVCSSIMRPLRHGGLWKLKASSLDSDHSELPSCPHPLLLGDLAQAP